MIDPIGQTEFVTLRSSCARCGSATGYILIKGGQQTVRCNTCDAYQGYNEPKAEGENTAGPQPRMEASVA